MAGEAEAGADEGDVFDGVLEDDEDVAVGARGVGVGCPPEVRPVVVELGVWCECRRGTWRGLKGTYVVVRHQDHALGKGMLDVAVCDLDLAFDAGVTACVDDGCGAELGYGEDE